MRLLWTRNGHPKSKSLDDVYTYGVRYRTLLGLDEDLHDDVAAEAALLRA